MTDFAALARARGFDLPEEQLARLAPSLVALERDFAALKSKLPHSLEPAIILSEPAVQGRGGEGK